MNELLKITNLWKLYGNTPALSNFNLTVDRGKIIGILGPNGSGKTTLIKLINGLLTPTEGNILIDGKAPGAETKKIISYLPDNIFLPYVDVSPFPEVMAAAMAGLGKKGKGGGNEIRGAYNEASRRLLPFRQ